MTLGGIRDLLPFLSFLADHRIGFRIEQDRPDSVMVTLTLLGARIEVDFFDDHIEYSVFEGSEFVLDDQVSLLARIEKDFA